MIHGYKEPVYTMTVDELITYLQELKRQGHEYSKMMFTGDENDTDHIVNDITTNEQVGVVWLMGLRA